MNQKKMVEFLNDPKSEMTYGRRIGLWLMQFKWYYPRAGEEDPTTEKNSEGFANSPRISTIVLEEKPSLARAWAYFGSTPATLMMS